MMKRIIKNILEERRVIFKKMSISSDCKWFGSKKLQNLADLVDVFYHPQGIEFCQKHNYPSLDILRTFKSLSVEKFGVYIDAGDITLCNPEKIILIGDTKATITCNKGGSNIIVMHHAEADITAKEWAVVRVHYNSGCKVNSLALDRAIINKTAV